MALTDALAPSRAVLRSGYLRRAPAWPTSSSEHREWLHFCLRTPGLDVLVNFSLIERVDASSGSRDLQGFVTTLVHDGRWTGSVADVPARQIVARRGCVDVTIGTNEIRFVDGAFHVTTCSVDPRVAVDLVLSPEVLPALAHNVPMPGGTRTSWFALPRLRASGRVHVGDRTHAVQGALAYHDHNWGPSVGADFTWQWAYLVPDDPASPHACVFVRIGDRMRAVTWMQGLFLWRNGAPQVGYRGRAITVSEEGLLRPSRVAKFPPIAALLSPGDATDVPERLVVHAGAPGDHLRFELDCLDAAQVVLPEIAARPTVINEIRGRARLEGVVGGERIAVESLAFAETVEPGS